MKDTKEQFKIIDSASGTVPFTWPTATESEVNINLKASPGTYARFLSMTV